jgi:hypothetical protein
MERKVTDELDDAILTCVEGGKELPVQRIVAETGRAYNTILIRCLKMQAEGLLQSVWYGNVRRFHIVNPKSQNAQRN